MFNLRLIVGHVVDLQLKNKGHLLIYKTPMNGTGIYLVYQVTYFYCHIYTRVYVCMLNVMMYVDVVCCSKV